MGACCESMNAAIFTSPRTGNGLRRRAPAALEYAQRANDVEEARAWSGLGDPLRRVACSPRSPVPAQYALCGRGTVRDEMPNLC